MNKNFGVAETRYEFRCRDVLWKVSTGVLKLSKIIFIPQISNANLANIYLGIAEGAFAAAKNYTCSYKKPWLTSEVESVTQDPFIKKMPKTLEDATDSGSHTWASDTAILILKRVCAISAIPGFVKNCKTL
ncbi:MAG: hypothetical protein ACLBM6_06940 [Cuspidothrix sp.]